MKISLTPELEQFVNRKVESGDYQTPSQVVCEGLELLREQEKTQQEQEQCQQAKLKELRRELAIGIAEADAGKTAPMDAREILAEIRRERAARLGEGS